MLRAHCGSIDLGDADDGVTFLLTFPVASPPNRLPLPE
jgi:hypothetical protein